MLLPSSKLSSAVVEVSAVELARTLAVAPGIPASVTSSASAISDVPTAFAAILSAVTALFAILASITESVVSLSWLTEPLAK